MRNNIFEPDLENIELLYWIATGMMAILVVAFFDVITVKIAIFIANVLTSGIPLIVLAMIVFSSWIRVSWRRKPWFR